MSKTFSEKNDKSFDVSAFSFFFVLSSCRVFLSDENSKNATKSVLQKNRVEKLFQRNRQNIQNRLFLDFVTRFWAFLGEGS
jgi:hypothetical protein